MPGLKEKAVSVLWGSCLVASLALLPLGVVIQFVALWIFALAVSAGARGRLLWEMLLPVGGYSLLVWLGFVGLLLSRRIPAKKEVSFRSLAPAALGWNALALFCVCSGCFVAPLIDPVLAALFAIFLFFLIPYIIKHISNPS